MATFRKRGSKWDYRIVDSNKNLIASKGGFKTKKEAELEAVRIEIKLKSGAVIDKQITLYELWQNWYETMVVPLGKSPSTLQKHQLRGDLLKRYFGEIPVVSITFSSYQRFINIQAQKWTKDTVRRLNAEVRKVIQFAKRDKLDVDDFTQGVIITGQKKEKAVEDSYISSIEDYNCLMQHVFNLLDYSESVISYLIYIELKTGMRFGEVLGLTWDCINWADQTIHTYRRYDSIQYAWRPPKTVTSDREVPADGDLMKVLFKLKSEQNKWLNLHGIRNPEKFLFLDPFYGVPTNAGVNKKLRSFLEELNIKPYNLTATGLRHTYASILLAKGIDIWVVANVLGHKDITQVTQTYGHLLKEKTDKEYQLIRKLLLQNSSNLVEQK